MTRRTEYSLDGVPDMVIQDAWHRKSASTLNAPETKAAVDQALAKLPERDREIVKLRTGFAGEATLRELGARFGVSPERIRQLHNRALAFLEKELSEFAM